MPVLLALAAMYASGCGPHTPHPDTPANGPAGPTSAQRAVANGSADPTKSERAPKVSHSTPDPSTTSAVEPAHADAAPPVLPASVDLRSTLLELGLSPRPQGGRGTCSVFTTCSALEFALAKQSGRAVRMSPEYLNWAGAKFSGRPSDGNFFHNAIGGWERWGMCSEDLMPYAGTYDAGREPSPEAAAAAEKVRYRAEGAVVVRWIVPWKPDRFGVNDEQFDEIRGVLAKGYPVAAGSGHSRLLVGYRDDDAAAGGGVFITLDSALNRFDEVTYEFVRKDVADVFWVECVKSEGREPLGK
jgi:hypothetical protein